MDLEILKEYCTGCGLCHSEKNIQFETDQKGYAYPKLTRDALVFCENVCPSAGKQSEHMTQEIWGHAENCYCGWSADKNIRKRASSGGILTAVACYLLEKGLVDGIIQTRKNKNKPYITETVVSSSVGDVLECMGSRYAVSMPLYKLRTMVEPGKTYAVVGRPCDISALRLLLSKDKSLEGQIKYLLSFFCAGVPSLDAQKKLLNSLGCEKLDDCLELQYRGNGWPGETVAVNKNGTHSIMTYSEAWGGILGRDVRKSCRFCFDGIGLSADISCGDLWYLDSYNHPSFEESDGRNIIFSRTVTGNKLLTDMISEGKIVTESYNPDSLRYVQKFQYERRACMGAQILGLKLCGRRYPHYNKKTMRTLGKNVKFMPKCKRTVGVIKRVLKGRL